jgi:tripartite-type tricarboxylate transporter receptor subunit TctC/quercetin dioxygenase-like cupin family protein
MKTETVTKEAAAITPAHTGIDGVAWNVMGQVYVPKQITADSFSWHATFPIETFVPPHMHPYQDEYIYVLEGRIDLLLDGKQQSAGVGDLVRMPRGIAHAFYNNSGLPAMALFWAAPAGKLVELYRRLHNVANPADAVRIARDYDVIFGPPVSSAKGATGMLGSLGSMGLWAALAATPLAAFAQTYPAKPIRLICPLPPGSPSDVLARTLAERIQASWGQPVVVENRPGATGAIGLDAVAKAAPDGYTVGVMFMTHTILPSLFGKVPYDTEKDFAPLANLVWLYNVLVVPASSEIASVPDLVARAKAAPNKLNYASGGNGSPAHLIAEFFKQNSSAQLTHVPFKGPADAVQNLLSAQVDLMFATTSTAIPQIRAGKLRPLVVTSPQRLAALADTPTMAEAGIQGFDVKEWQGLVAPAGTPREIVVKWNDELVKAMAAPQVRERLTALGMDAVGGNSPEQFRTLIANELGRWSKLARELKLKVD